ncbi:hypothetical protein HY771_03310 [Candidatus Uhrbacteria bacterium]|nr:hypothetical protein [Candidatus Uhrbacteria bacterium]
MDFYDAVFNCFGQCDPLKDDELALLCARHDAPTDEEYTHILDDNDGTAENIASCQRVHDDLARFYANSDAFVASLADTDPRKPAIKQIADALMKKRSASTAPPAASTATPTATPTVVSATPPRTTPLPVSAPKPTPTSAPPAVPTSASTALPTASISTVDPITVEMKALLKTEQWKAMRTALEDAAIAQDTKKFELAVTLREQYLNGVYGAQGRIFGALMRECMKDLAEGLHTKNRTEFSRRYGT